MKIKDCMSGSVSIAAPTDTIQSAADTMRRIDAGSLPVGENDRLVGMITDRDIAVRAIAQGMGPDTAVRDVMTTDIRYCFEDEDIESVSRQMGEYKVRRLPVLNRDKRLIGIVSLGDVSHSDGPVTAKALSDITERGGLHSQH